MKTVFVVLQCEYDYEDSSQYPILVTPYESIADVKVAEMLARQEARNKAYESICQHMKVWEMLNPRPRDVLKPGNKKKPPKPFAERFAKWIPLRHTEQVRFTEALPQQIQDDLRGISTKTIWEVEQVPFAEQ